MERLDRVGSMGLKGRVRQQMTKEEVAIVRSALESRREDLRRRMDRVWREALAVDRRIAANVGPVDPKLTEKMAVLRRRHHRLADRGYDVELRLSELLGPSPRPAGRKWRPTVAEQF